LKVDRAPRTGFGLVAESAVANSTAANRNFMTPLPPEALVRVKVGLSLIY
jgi:hypothetical protein